jgi:hypothetical protein
MLLCERIRSRGVVGDACDSRSRGLDIVSMVVTDDADDARAHANAHRIVHDSHRRAHRILHHRRRSDDVDGALRVPPTMVRVVGDDAALTAAPSARRAVPKVLRRYRRVNRTTRRIVCHRHQGTLAHDGASPRAPKLLLPRRRAHRSPKQIARTERARALLVDPTARASSIHPLSANNHDHHFGVVICSFIGSRT